MQINILIFGQLAEITRSREVIFNDINDTETLKNVLQEKYPGSSELPYLIAVDKEIVSANTILNDKSIVALLPPYAGG